MVFVHGSKVHNRTFVFTFMCYIALKQISLIRNYSHKMWTENTKHFFLKFLAVLHVTQKHCGASSSQLAFNTITSSTYCSASLSPALGLLCESSALLLFCTTCKIVFFLP